MPATPRTSTERSTLDQLLATIPAMRQMPRREVKVLRQKPYSLCLEKLDDVLQDGEQVVTVTCAVSAARGRGVLVLTDGRLVLITLRTGTCEWALDDLHGIRGRAAKFTVPAAIYLDTPAKTHVIVVGDGPVWGPRFTASVRGLHGSRSQPESLAA